MADAPVCHQGLYRFRDRVYMALRLVTHGDAWASTALVSHPFLASPFAMLYLRHADGVLLDYRDWQPVGVVADLVPLPSDDVPEIDIQVEVRP